MTTRTFSPCSFALLAATLVCAPAAQADPPTVAPPMQKAIQQLEQGPDQLRRFVHRTRMIYELDYADVVAAYKAAYGENTPARLATSAGAAKMDAAVQGERH